MSKYLVYPQAEEKLRNSGLLQRIEDANKDDRIPQFNTFTKNELRELVSELKERRYYKHTPEHLKDSYRDSMNQLFMKYEDFSWTVSRTKSESKHPVDLNDLQLLIGWPASFVLSPEEFWDYEKFGFASPVEFLGTLSAKIYSATRDFHDRRVYSWNTTLSNGMQTTTSVTGDINCDLRIFQDDITPYHTIDPLGNIVLYRPMNSEDKRTIAGYHSTEGHLLATIIKYIEQENIGSEVFKDKASSLIKEIRKIGQHGGTCTEHFGGYDSQAEQFFWSHNHKIPQLDVNFSTTKPSIDSIHTITYDTNEYSNYYAYVGPEKELCFAYEPTIFEKRSAKKQLRLSIPPQDVDHLIRSTLQQATYGLGRTSARQLIDILEYYFSDKFKEDQNSWKLDDKTDKSGE